MNFSLNETFLLVFVAVAALAGLITFLVQRAAARTTDRERLARLEMLNSHIRGSWSVLAIFTIAFVLGKWALLVVFALASFFALREFLSLTPIKSSDHWALVIAFYGIIPAQYLLLGFGRASVVSTFIPVYVFLLLPVIVAIRQDNERFLERVAKLQWGLMISVYCISFAPAIATLPIRGFEDRGPLLLMFFLAVLLLTDAMQLVASAALGGRALRSNPKKTIRGLAAGSGVGALMGTALAWLTPFTWWQALVMSLVIVGTGYLGTVVLASVKQSLGAREWDAEVVLTRGVLERLEALTFAAPLFWQVTRYFWVIRADV
jgi:phosphatidate cytidylyltransferase